MIAGRRLSTRPGREIALKCPAHSAVIVSRLHQHAVGHDREIGFVDDTVTVTHPLELFRAQVTVLARRTPPTPGRARSR